MSIDRPRLASPPPSIWRRCRIPLAVGGLALAFLVVRVSGLTDLVGDEERLQRLVDDAGWMGPVVFTVAASALIAVGVPGVALVLPAAVVFSTPIAIAVTLVTSYLSSGAGMWFARTMGRDTLAARMPNRFRTWDTRIADRGLPAVIALRCITYLAAPADWLLGLSSIRTRTLVIGTGVGMVPPTLFYVIGGGGLLDRIL